MKKELGLSIILLLFLLLAGCGSDRNNAALNANSGAITFGLSWDAGSSSSKALMAPPPGTDVCTYYQIDRINIYVWNSSGDTVATGSALCSDHTLTISGLPVGTVGVTIQVLVGTAVVWSGQTTGMINVVAGQTADAGKIVMAYKGTDHTPPTVTSVTPTSGASGVSLGASVSAIFSEPVVTASVTTSTFTLICSSTAITGTVAYDSAILTATFDPTALLPASTTCNATITTGVEDLAGNLMASDYIWSFTTGAAQLTTGTWDVSTWNNALWGT